MKRGTQKRVNAKTSSREQALKTNFLDLLLKLEQERQETFLTGQSFLSQCMNLYYKIFVENETGFSPYKRAEFIEASLEVARLNQQFLNKKEESEFIKEHLNYPMQVALLKLSKRLNNGLVDFAFNVRMPHPLFKLHPGIQAGIMRLLYSLAEVTNVYTLVAKVEVMVHMTEETVILTYHDALAATQAHQFAPAMRIAQTLTDEAHIGFEQNVFYFKMPVPEFNLIEK